LKCEIAPRDSDRGSCRKWKRKFLFERMSTIHTNLQVRDSREHVRRWVRSEVGNIAEATLRQFWPLRILQSQFRVCTGRSAPVRTYRWSKIRVRRARSLRLSANTQEIRVIHIVLLVFSFIRFNDIISILFLLRRLERTMCGVKGSSSGAARGRLQRRRPLLDHLQGETLTMTDLGER